MVKITDKHEGEDWSLEEALAVEREYREFFKLSALQDGNPVVPTKRIDKMWHYHILDTAKYHADCEMAFGFFLHHFPYFGVRGEEDRKNLESAFRNTLERVEKIFERPWSTTSPPGLSICTSCGTSDCAPTPSCASISSSALIRSSERPRLYT